MLVKLKQRSNNCHLIINYRMLILHNTRPAFNSKEGMFKCLKSTEGQRGQMSVWRWWLSTQPKLYLESFDSLLSSRGWHDALLDAGDWLKAHLAAQRARGRRGCQGTNRGCGEMARALVLWGYQVSMLIVLNVFEVWANSRRERRREKKECNTERGGIGPGQDRGNKPCKMEEPNIKKERGEKEMGKRKGQRGGETNVRHASYIKGLRQHNGQLQGAAVFTPGSLMLAAALQLP